MKKNITMKLALEGSILQWLLKLALPILIGNLLQSAYQFVDAYWVGKLGKEAVAAVSISGPIIFLIIALWTGFSMAGTILISQYAGAKNKAMVNKSAAQTILIDIVIALALGVIGFLQVENILHYMGVDPSIAKQSVNFMKITFLGIWFTFIFSVVQSILRGIWEVKVPMYIILSTVILNFIIDPILILWRGPIPSLGIQGAALATVGTQGLAACIWLILLFNGCYGIKLQRKDFKPDLWFTKKVFWLGFPSSLEMAIRALGLVVMTSLIAGFGTIALAGFGAAGNIFQLIFIPTLGLSIATSTMIGQNLWAQQYERASSIAKISATVAFISLTTLGIFIFMLAPHLIQIFIHDDYEVIAIGTTFLRISALSFGVMGVQFSLTGVFRAAGNTILTLILGLISMFIIQFPIAYLLAYHTGLWIHGIRWSYFIVNIFMAIICTIIYLQGDWKYTKLIHNTIKNSLNK